MLDMMLADAGGVTGVAQFGVAGLMGALWWWERRYSREREEELTEAHREILRGREELGVVLEALRGNTEAIAEFTGVQQEMLRVMRELAE